MNKAIIRVISVLILIPVLCFGKTIDDTVDILQKSITPEAKGKMYIGIKNISPLSDLTRLCDLGDIFDRYGIPFIVEISSKLDGLDSTQVEQYTQVLHYLQSRGGAICLSRTDEQDGQVLSKQGIILMQLPKDIYRIDYQTLERLDVDQKPFPKLGVDVIIEYNLPTSSEEILEIVEWINDKWLRLTSLSEEEGYKIYSGNEEWIQDVDSQESEETAYSKFFIIGNKILLILVGISLLILGIGIIVGRLLYKEKFYKVEAKEKKR